MVAHVGARISVVGLEYSCTTLYTLRRSSCAEGTYAVLFVRVIGGKARISGCSAVGSGTRGRALASCGSLARVLELEAAG